MNISLNFFNPLRRSRFLARAGIIPSACAVLFLLAGCALPLGSGGPGPGSGKSPFRPPTPAGIPAGTTLQASTKAAQGQAAAGNSATEASLPTPTVLCKDSLVFIKDVTIPDGTSVAPASTMDKRWEVENNGNCNWGENYRLRLIAGSEMGSQKEQALYPARSGSRAVIRIVFKAPLEPGAYRSAWQAINARGEPFGDPFFIDIKVETP